MKRRVRVAVPTILGLRVYEVKPAADVTLCKYAAMDKAKADGFDLRGVRTEVMMSCKIVGKSFQGVPLPAMTDVKRRLLKRWAWLQGRCMTEREFKLCFAKLVDDVMEETFKQLAAKHALSKNISGHQPRT